MNGNIAAGTFQSPRAVAPLPSPKDLAEYEQLVPGAGEKLLQLLQDQQKHRFEVESAVILGERRAAGLGQVFAFLFAFLCFGAAFYLLVQGAEWPGTIIAAGSLMMCITAFVFGRAPGKHLERRDVHFDEPSNGGA